MGAGSVPTLRKTGGALYHRLPAGNMPRRDKFHARAAHLPRQARRHPPWNASGRNISVLFLKQPKPGVHIAVGHLEQACRATAALVDDAVAVRQREDVVLVPSDGIAADLLSPEPSTTQHTEFAVVRKGSVIASGSSCTRKQSIIAIPEPPVSGLT